jgi:predicted metal-dependent hydrolase
VPLRAGQPVPVLLKPRAASQSIKLYFDPVKHCFVLRHPLFVSERRLYQFIEEHHKWLSRVHAEQPPLRMIHPGDVFQFFGDTYKIQKDKLRPKGVHKDGQAIWVGQSIKDSKAIELFLRKQAKLFFESTAADYAHKLQVTFDKVSVRDTKTRWGSCSSSKTLSFSWRLGFAPVEVAKYVAAHEVSHLIEMNHSPSFWALVKKICPTYKDHKKWLKTKGQSLMMIKIKI